MIALTAMAIVAALCGSFFLPALFIGGAALGLGLLGCAWDAFRVARLPDIQRPGGGFVYGIAFAVLAVAGPAGVVLALGVGVVEAVAVPSDSMRPLLASGDAVIVDRTAYRRRPPSRGDVVSWDADLEPLARVVGVAGDEVEISLGRLFVNGTDVELRPLSSPRAGGGGAQIFEERLGTAHRIRLSAAAATSGLVHVPPGHVLLLGDDRTFGPQRAPTVPCSALAGRVWRVFWRQGRLSWQKVE